jgi:hypothetical protein
MKSLLSDLSSKVDKEDISRPTTGNESWHEINNGNEVRSVNFATSEILPLFLHYNIHIFTWTSPGGKTLSHFELI